MINKAEKLAKAIEFTHLDNTATVEEMKAFLKIYYQKKFTYK